MAKYYQVVYLDLNKINGMFQTQIPKIVPHSGDTTPLKWRDAKKEVREFYLQQAADLRSKSELDINNG